MDPEVVIHTRMPHAASSFQSFPLKVDPFFTASLPAWLFLRALLASMTSGETTTKLPDPGGLTVTGAGVV